MSAAKRYTVTRHATVFDVTDARGVAGCVLASDAARIARLLNAEAEVRAALRVLTAFAATHTGNGATRDEGRLLDGYGNGIEHAVEAGRSALSALGEE